MNTKYLFIASLFFASVAPGLRAHDTWVEAASSWVPQGEYTYVHLMLGNHGNGHRDFKLASKITLAPCELYAFRPDGTKLDLKPHVIDMGSAEKEGFWTARFPVETVGVHRVVHTLDTLHRTTRAIKSAKTFVLGTRDGQTRLPTESSDRSYGFGLEFVLRTPLRNLSAGQPMELQVLRDGKPASGVRVSFIPRGETLAAEFDAEFERESDAGGLVRFTPKQGNMILAVAHHLEADEAGEGYDQTHYSAAMVLAVPNSPATGR